MGADRRVADRLRSTWRSLATPITDDDAQARRERFAARIVAIDLSIVVVLVGAVLSWLLRLWSTSLRVPFGYTGDSLFYGLNAKSIIESGWVQESSRVGAPFGLELYDFPVGGDTGNYAVMKVISWFTGDWAVLVNTFYLLGFFTTGIVSYLCLRWLGAGRVASVVCAVVYSFAPFHFFRLGHLMLAHYAVVPIGVVLAMRAASGRSFTSDGSRRATAVAWVVACVSVGSFGSYWAIFSVISIVFVALLASVTHRTIRPVVAAASFSAAIGAVFVLSQLGTVLYHRSHGPNPAVGHRVPIEADLYGLRLVQLLTPVPGSRFRFLNGTTRTLLQGYASEDSMFLGLIGGGAFGALLVWLAIRVVRGTRSSASDGVAALLAVLGLFWVLLATTGGLNWFLLVIDFDRIRGWSRASIVLLFISLAWASRWLAPRVLERLARLRRAPPGSALALGVVVLVVGVFDQTPRGPVVFDPRSHEAAFESDRAFFGEIESELPEGALVAQLPIRRFPEEPALHGSIDYDLLRPYLSTDDLRWTYGGMKWRQSEWQQALVGQPADELVRDLVAVGVAALVIDRAGYEDQAASLEGDLARMLGRQPRASADGRWSYFGLDVGDDLGDADARARRRRQLLEQPILTLPECSPWEGDTDEAVAWCEGTGSITIVTPTPSDDAAEVRFDVATWAGTGRLRLRGEGVSLDVPLGPQGTTVELTVPPGEDYFRVEFVADAPTIGPGDDRRFYVSDVEPDPR